MSFEGNVLKKHSLRMTEWLVSFIRVIGYDYYQLTTNIVS